MHHPQINRNNFGHHSFQGDAQKQLRQMFQRQTATSSPQILSKIEALVLPKRKQRPQNEGVRRLLKSARVALAASGNAAAPAPEPMAASGDAPPPEPMETDEADDINDDGAMSLNDALLDEFEARIELISHDDDDDDNMEIVFQPPPPQ